MFAVESAVTRWFQGRFPAPTPVQAAAAPVVESGRNVLLVSPTGTGKTLAAFLGILHQLALEAGQGGMPAGIQALYVSPLRALNYDLRKNLAGPLAEIFPAGEVIRVGLRTGDTPPAERQRQFQSPPHLLLTTPESLCVLLSQSRWIPSLASIRWVVVDEVHALAGNKRGSHLSLALERLEALRPPGRALQRIGLSATVAPVEAMAGFLAGTGRACEVAEVATARRIDLDVYSPLKRDPYPPAGFSGVRLIRELGRLVRQHRTTLVFTNTRSGAESATHWLKTEIPELAGQIECHHASLDRDLRLDVEDRLKAGQLRAVVCSTSLELGIDIGQVDLVVMLGTPKGVSRALQRAGRSGHRIHLTSRGLLMATNPHDLVECCATARLARRRHLDAIRIPEAPLDVLAQQLIGMGCLGPIPRDEAWTRVRQAWPYRHLPRADFDAVLEYLAGGGRSLQARYSDLFGRIHLDSHGWETRAGPTRRDFLENIGSIASDEAVPVVLNARPVGTVEEGFLRQVQPGDVFLLGGRPLRVEKMTGTECRVVAAPGAVPTIPRWGANKFPLSNRVAAEIRDFRRELRGRLATTPGSPELLRWIESRLDCGPHNAAVILRVHAAQQAVSEIPTADFLLVEEFLEFPEPAPPGGPPHPAKHRPPARPAADESPEPGGQLAFGPLLFPRRPAARQPRPSAVVPVKAGETAGPVRVHYFFHALVGRAANDALSRVVALRLSRAVGGNAIATADDYGFVLTVAPEQVLKGEDLARLLAPEGFEADLLAAVERSSLLEYHFRQAAQSGQMIQRTHFGERKAARKMQWSAEVIFQVLSRHEPGHVLLRQARQDALTTFLDAPEAAHYLAELKHAGFPIRFRRVGRVPPLSFVMYASRIREVLEVEDPQATLERLFARWWEPLAGSGEVPAEAAVSP
ncbi:MAG: DEAD/DEAH box helicase [Verrucomicrobiota bacterium]